MDREEVLSIMICHSAAPWNESQSQWSVGCLVVNVDSLAAAPDKNGGVPAVFFPNKACDRRVARYRTARIFYLCPLTPAVGSSIKSGTLRFDKTSCRTIVDPRAHKAAHVLTSAFDAHRKHVHAQ